MHAYMSPACLEHAYCKLGLIDTNIPKYMEYPGSKGENYLCMTDDKGEKYRGFVDRTFDNKECQRWDVNHAKYKILSYFRQDRNHNFCRNPDGDPKGPWCYLKDFDGETVLGHENRGYCNIDRC